MGIRENITFQKGYKQEVSISVLSYIRSRKWNAVI